MKSKPKNRNSSAPYHIRPSDWRRRAPSPQSRDTPSAAPEFDSACWLETASGAAIAIHTFADHREEDL
jgi:hypothetical protein